MNVKYKRAGFRGERLTDQDSIPAWIQDNLKQGGIERQLLRTQRLVAMIGEKFLTRNPDLVSEVAKVIGCEGFHHKMVHTEP